eukprot:720099-Hanusia_phi.AAC.1
MARIAAMAVLVSSVSSFSSSSSSSTTTTSCELFSSPSSSPLFCFSYPRFSSPLAPSSFVSRSSDVCNNKIARRDQRTQRIKTCMSMKRGGRRMALEVIAGVAAWPQVAGALFEDKVGWGEADKVGVKWDGGFANPLASQPDDFNTEVVNGKGNPVVISFTKPKKWKLSTNAGITVQDYISAESAFVLVAPAQGFSLSTLPPDYVLEKVFDSRGRCEETGRGLC